MRSAVLALMVAAAPVGLAAPAFAQSPQEQAASRLDAQREAMKALSMMDGEWRGPARALRGDGGWRDLIQSERVGTMLDGTVRVIEGRGYELDGRVSFTAFAVISYDPDKKTYSMRSYSSGREGDFPIVPTADGFTWEIQAGPDMKIAYVATIKDGVWTEVGTRIPKNGPAVKFIEFSVTRLGDSQWPAAGAIAPR